ncbi:MAG: CRTAC1 family protein [Armatimonadota bacterium]
MRDSLARLRARPCLRSLAWAFVCALIVAVAASGCGPKKPAPGPPAPPAPRRAAPPPPPDPKVREFVDVTDAAGLDFVHSIGDGELSNLVEAVGGGAGWLDYDGDGCMDLYVLTGNYTKGLSAGDPPGPPQSNRLFRNRGDGTFEDVTDRARVGHQGYGMGLAVADYDNDGDADIYVLNHGPNLLYRNNGDGTFTDATKRAGLGGGERCTVAAGFLDYDNDGFLDLYVGNYIEFDPEYDHYYAPDGMPGPLDYAAQPDLLYHNRGDGTFEDVTQSMGVGDSRSRAMGVTTVDFDQDGWVDIYVANDASANFLYRNLEGKGFQEVAPASGTAYSEQGESTASMTGDFGDCDGDGLLDIVISDDAFGSLYMNVDNSRFEDRTAAAGVAKAKGQYISWGIALMDYDHDGDLDIFMVNGDFHHLYPMEDLLLENDGSGRFSDVSPQRGAWFQEKWVGRGGAFGDYDNDGDLDVFIMNLDGQCALLRNDVCQGTNWLGVHLVGSRSNRDAVGARVKVVAGDLVQVGQRKGAYGYLCTHDPRLNFGLGAHEKVDRLEVTWPSGQTQALENVEAKQIVTITEEES